MIAYLGIQEPGSCATRSDLGSSRLRDLQDTGIALPRQYLHAVTRDDGRHAARNRE